MASAMAAYFVSSAPASRARAARRLARRASSGAWRRRPGRAGCWPAPRRGSSAAGARSAARLSAGRRAWLAQSGRASQRSTKAAPRPLHESASAASAAHARRARPRPASPGERALEHQRAHAFRMAGRETQRDPPAHRVAEHVRPRSRPAGRAAPPDRRRVCAIVVAAPGRRALVAPWPGRSGAISVNRSAQAACEGRPHGMAAGEAVQQQQRRAPSGKLDIMFDVAERDPSRPDAAPSARLTARPERAVLGHVLRAVACAPPRRSARRRSGPATPRRGRRPTWPARSSRAPYSRRGGREVEAVRRAEQRLEARLAPPRLAWRQEGEDAAAVVVERDDRRAQRRAACAASRPFRSW